MDDRITNLARASWLILGLGVAGILLRWIVIFGRPRLDIRETVSVAGIALQDVALVIGVFVAVRTLLAIYGALAQRPGGGANELDDSGERSRYEEDA